MARSIMWALALVAVFAAQANAQGTVTVTTKLNSTESGSLTITSATLNYTETYFRSISLVETQTYILPLSTPVPCGGCPGLYTCCHVGSAYRFNYQCLAGFKAPPVTVTVVPPPTCKSCSKPKPAPKAPVVVTSYCKCGKGSACCQVGKSYKCVAVAVPKPVKCGKKTCGAGSGCTKGKGWWKKSKCTKAVYRWWH